MSSIHFPADYVAEPAHHEPQAARWWMSGFAVGLFFGGLFGFLIAMQV